MRAFLLLWMCLLGLQAADLTTRDGKVYKNYTVIGHDAGFITIMYADGGGKIPLSNLPEELQKQYHYDPTKAAAFAKSVEEQDHQSALATARFQTETSIVKEQKDAEHQAEHEAERLAEIDHNFNTGYIGGKVSKVYKEGILVDGYVQNADYDKSIPAAQSWRKTCTFLLVGYPDDVAEGDVIHAIGYQDTILHSLTTSSGAGIDQSVHTYVFVAQAPID